MFKRPFDSKSKSPLRSSDLRKLRDEVATLFNLDDASQAKLALPDGVLTCKGSTHLDEPLVLYFTPNGDPCFFRTGKSSSDMLVPTCYTFDILPQLLPKLVTASAVIDNLVKGAALFSAGVSDKSLRDLPDDMQQGDLVAITAGSSPLIVAVGQLAESKRALEADRKGKAVMTLHARGDFLWASGSGEQQTLAEPSSLDSVGREKEKPSERKDSESELASQLSSTKLDSQPASETAELSGADVDKILRNALLLAISQTLSKDGSLFPMTASTLYSTYVLPNRPVGTPASADIKKSATWKKLANFMKSMTKEGLITTKEMRGELTVTGVNGDHKDVQTFRPYRTLASTPSASTAGSSTDTQHSANGSGSKIAGDVAVHELYKATSSTLPVFQAVDHERPELDLYTFHDLKKLLSEYSALEQLVHPRDQKYITPNETLSKMLLKTDEQVEVLSKDEAHKRFVAACQPYWTLQRRGGDKIVKKGSPPLVRIAIKNVGKRHVTLISNHEAWSDMDLFTSEEIAEDLKKRSASSTSIQPLAGSAKKGQQPKVEIMCQGTHDKLVCTILKDRGVPTKYIDIDTSKSRK
ncbi:hypothetical protein OIO90_004694 [Microbotryomycetes sp. JL221]|nr:hypothetical protein OIO90_004694 [Microbotryomycetes sp. JL221]